MPEDVKTDEKGEASRGGGPRWEGEGPCLLVPFAHSPPPELQPYSRARICLSLSAKD